MIKNFFLVGMEFLFVKGVSQYASRKIIRQYNTAEDVIML